MIMSKSRLLIAALYIEMLMLITMKIMIVRTMIRLIVMMSRLKHEKGNRIPLGCQVEHGTVMLVISEAPTACKT